MITQIDIYNAHKKVINALTVLVDQIDTDGNNIEECRQKVTDEKTNLFKLERLYEREQDDFFNDIMQNIENHEDLP
jgi:hypothetical protein